MNAAATSLALDCSDPLYLWERALGDYLAGNTHKVLYLVDETGRRVAETFVQYFEREHELTPNGAAFIEHSRGDILDVGAGAGRHASLLQEKGHQVVALDKAPLPVRLLRERGLTVRQADIWSFDEGIYDTILLAGHNVGMAGTLDGLRRLLVRFASLLAPGGQVLLDSVDLPDQAPRYRSDGSYAGEACLHLAYGGETGPAFPWLCIDYCTLQELSEDAGWSCQRLSTDPNSDFLAQLTRR